MTSEQKDIVTQLRAVLHNDRSVELMARDAADEIERLRAELVSKADELAATLRQLRKVETECSMLRVECGLLERNAETTYENHKRIVAELTAERDEARRLLCQFESRLDFEYGNIDPSRFGPVALAADRGWDCFKEDKR